jgi:hypothetical protein
MKTTMSCALFLICAAVAPAGAQNCPPSSPPQAVCVTLTEDADVVVNVTVDDQPEDISTPVASFALAVDDNPTEEILIFQGTGRHSYAAIVGPLSKGAHQLALIRSPFWPEPVVRLRDFTARVVTEADQDFVIVHHAPAIWARADTIGQATDLLLAMYVEQSREDDGSITLTYSTIFSNEDGGTSTRALMARWGRTTDIEWMYEVGLSARQVVRERFQAANHRTRAFNGTHVGAHPLIVVATLNNVFADTGRTPVLLRPYPIRADLSDATRESVMDGERWMYRVMGRELADEGKIRLGNRLPSTGMIDDPRSYLYIEGKLTLRNAAVAAVVEDNAGIFHTSNLGSLALSVARNGFVRLAVPAGEGSARAIGWMCLSRQTSMEDDEMIQPSDCRIDGLRAIRLNNSFEIEPVLLDRSAFQLAAGEMRTTAVRGQVSR